MVHRLDRKRMQVLDALADAARSELRDSLTVEQVMTVSPTCISPDVDALELVRLFNAKGYRHLLVADRGRLEGVISDRDVLPCFGLTKHPDQDALRSICARQLMSTDLLTVEPDTPLEQAIVMMVDHGISCLPVLADQRLVGILTNTDIQIVAQMMLQTVRRALPEESASMPATIPYDPSSRPRDGRSRSGS